MGSALLLLLPAAIVGPAALILWVLYCSHPGQPPAPARLLQAYMVGFATSLPAIALEAVLLVLLLPALIAQVSPLITIAALSAGIGLIEEGAKYRFLDRRAIAGSGVRVPYDAVLLAVAVGLGFATVENRGYFFGAAAGGGAGLAVLVVGRLLLSTPAHALFGAIMGYHLGRAAAAADEDERRRARRWAYLHPAAWHALYDFFVLYAAQAGGAVALASWVGFAVTMIAIWVIGLRMIVRAVRMQPVPAPAGIPPAAPPPATFIRPARLDDGDLAAWARPRPVTEP